MTPLLLVPGLLCDRALFRAQVDALGGSTEVGVTTAQARHDSIAATVAEILAAAPPRFALAGLSMGGYVALELVRTAPERVTRLALLDTTARPDAPEQTTRRRDLMALVAQGRFGEVCGALARSFIAPSRHADEVLLGAIVAMAERVGAEAFLRQQRAIIARRDQRDTLPAIRCPTLVLCGREDTLTPPPLAEEIAAAIPGAELRLLDGSGHLSPMEAPEAVSAALRAWLGGA